MLVLQKIWVRFSHNVTGLSLSQTRSWMRNLLCTKIGNQIWLTQCMFEFLGSAQTSSASADGHENHKTVCTRKTKIWVVGFFNFKLVKLATKLQVLILKILSDWHHIWVTAWLLFVCRSNVHIVYPKPASPWKQSVALIIRWLAVCGGFCG